MGRKAAWEASFQVKGYEVGPSGEARIDSLANYLQETADQHAENLEVGEQALLKAGKSWVLTRLFLRFDAFPRMGERITVQTWPSGLDRLAAQRDFRVTGEGGRELGVATSAWVIFNLAERSMDPMPASMEKLYLEGRPGRALEFTTRLVKRLKRHEHEKEFRVRESDLDILGHANNVRYPAWSVESIPREMREGCRLVELDIQFRNEARVDDRVLGRCAEGDGSGEMLHALVREEDGTELVRARTLWSRVKS